MNRYFDIVRIQDGAVLDTIYGQFKDAERLRRIMWDERTTKTQPAAVRSIEGIKIEHECFDTFSYIQARDFKGFMFEIVYRELTGDWYLNTDEDDIGDLDKIFVPERKITVQEYFFIPKIESLFTCQYCDGHGKYLNQDDIVSDCEECKSAPFSNKY